MIRHYSLLKKFPILCSVMSSNLFNILYFIKGALLLKGLKVIGGTWDSSKKSIVKSDNFLNQLPPILVHVSKKSLASEQEAQKSIQAYLTHLRQTHIESISIAASCNEEFIPYIAFDTGYEENQSRRRQRPIQASINSLSNTVRNNNFPSTGSPSLETDRTMTTTKSQQLLIAGQAIKQDLLRSNQTLNQIREVSTEKFPSQESQLSFKPMSPNAPPLPADLQALVRADHLN